MLLGDLHQVGGRPIHHQPGRRGDPKANRVRDGVRHVKGLDHKTAEGKPLAWLDRALRDLVEQLMLFDFIRDQAEV